MCGIKCDLQDIARCLSRENQIAGEFSSFQAGLACFKHTFQVITRFLCEESHFGGEFSSVKAGPALTWVIIKIEQDFDAQILSFLANFLRSKWDAL